jgi:glycerol-1-phosphate dehydrogenase [NAD(P)+]
MQLFNTIYGRNLVAELPLILPRPYLVVSMDDLWPRFAPAFDDGLAAAHLVRTLERDELEAIVRDELPACEAVVGLGGGQAIDVAKFVAMRRRVPLFQVPTALSVNAPFGHRTAIRTDGVVRYRGWVVPEAVFVDYDVVQAAPALLNRAGVCDVFCYHTARHDWQLAERTGNVEPKWRWDPQWADAAKHVLDSCLAAVGDIHECTEHGVRTLMEGLRWGGAAFANAGWNPRPIEGAEHFFFYSLEHLTRRHYVHGQPVCLGILLISALQENEPDRIRRAIDAVGVPYLPEDMGATWDEVFEALERMPEAVERGDLWWTIASHRPVDREFCERAREWLTTPGAAWG